MMSSSFDFIFTLGQIFRYCAEIELYCVLVVGPKKNKSSHFSCSSSGCKFVPI